MKKLSHLNKKGKAKMVDIGSKDVTLRTAKAESTIRFQKKAMDYLKENSFSSSKGSIEQVATVAGTMAVKNTSSLIPMCHPLRITGCKFNFKKKDNKIKITCKVACEGKTGVEMEALTGASVAALTIYDMCKSVGKDMVIEQTRLIRKTGGKSDYKA